MSVLVNHEFTVLEVREGLGVKWEEGKKDELGGSGDKRSGLEEDGERVDASSRWRQRWHE